MQDDEEAADHRLERPLADLHPLCGKTARLAEDLQAAPAREQAATEMLQTKEAELKDAAEKNKGPLTKEIGEVEDQIDSAYTNGDADTLSTLAGKRKALQSRLADAHRDLQQDLSDARREAAASMQAAKEDLKARHEQLVHDLKSTWSSTRRNLSSDAASLLAHLDRLRVADSPKAIPARRCLQRYPLLLHGCSPSSAGNARHLPSLEAAMFTEAWAVALGLRRPVNILVPLVPSNTTRVPALLCAFNPKGCMEKDRSSGPLWKLDDGSGRGYASLPWWARGMPPEQKPEAHIILEPFSVSDEWLTLALGPLRGTGEVAANAEAVEPELTLGPTGLQAVEIHSQRAQSLYMQKAGIKASQDATRFLKLTAVLSVTIVVFFGAVECCKSTGSECSVECAWQFLVKREINGERVGFIDDQASDYIVIGVFLLVLHTTLLVWIPLQGMSEARCMDRFDWHKHEWYTVYQS